MSELQGSPPFDAAVMRRLVDSDPLLAYTVVRRAGENEEQWLQRLFTLEVCSDPGLAYRYRGLMKAAR